jgi:chromosomal replication initiation ATPase DnaA
MAEIASPRIASIGTPAPKPEAPALPALARQLPATPGRILVRRAIKATAEHLGTTQDALVSARQTQPLTRRRQVAMYVAHKMTGCSLVFIGGKIGDPTIEASMMLGCLL